MNKQEFSSPFKDQGFLPKQWHENSFVILIGYLDYLLHKIIELMNLWLNNDNIYYGHWQAIHVNGFYHVQYMQWYM